MKNIDKKIEEILSDIDFAEWGRDEQDYVDKIKQLLHEYGVWLIGEDEEVVGRVANKDGKVVEVIENIQTPQTKAKNNLRQQQRKLNDEIKS